MLRLGDRRLCLALVVSYGLHRPDGADRCAMPQERRGPVLRLFLAGGENGMFSHIMIGSNDIARSKKFYDALFTAIGGQPGTEPREGRLAYAHNGSRFLVTKPNDGNTPHPPTAGHTG